MCTHRRAVLWSCPPPFRHDPACMAGPLLSASRHIGGKWRLCACVTILIARLEPHSRKKRNQSVVTRARVWEAPLSAQRWIVARGARSSAEPCSKSRPGGINRRHLTQRPVNRLARSGFRTMLSAMALGRVLQAADGARARRRVQKRWLHRGENLERRPPPARRLQFRRIEHMMHRRARLARGHAPKLAERTRVSARRKRCRRQRELPDTRQSDLERPDRRRR